MTNIQASLDSPPQKGPGGAPIRVGTYTDTFGVTHTITTNRLGQVDKDVWTADSVAYTRLAVYDPYLYANVSNSSAADTRLNNKLLLPATSTLNGVQEGRYVRWDVRGRAYKIGYDANPANDFETFTYDANDRLVIADGDGSNDITRFEYENSTPEARLTRVWRANDGGGQPTVTAQETKWFYQGTDTFLPSSVKTHGVTYTLAYDSANNLASVADGLLLGSTAYAHDSRGNVTSVISRNPSNQPVAWQNYSFDANDRLITSSDALGNVTTYNYSWQGCGCSEGDKLTSVHTPDLPSNSSWTLEYFTDSGRLKNIKDPDGHATSMGYTDLTNRLSSVTDGNLHAATMGYDQLGRLSSGSDPQLRSFARAYPVPASGAWTNASVLAGSPNSTAAPTSLTATLADGQYQIGVARYQDKGNPAQLSFYRDATFEISYGMTWDRSRRLYQRRDRNGLGITTGPALPTGFGQYDDWTNGYDLRTAGPAMTNTDTTYTPFYERSTAVYNDELDVTSRVGDGQRLPYVFSDVYTRDAAGRVTQEARKIQTTMNEPSQLQGVPSKSSSPQVVVEPLLKFSYDANGRVSQWTDGDGIHDVFYDTRGLVWKVTVQGGEGDFLFEYDIVGRNTKVTYPLGALVRTQVFDHQGRVTNRCYTQSSTSRCYGATYDAVGNPLTLTDPEVNGTDTIAYDALDRLQTITRTGSPTQNFDYNQLGALHTNGTATLDDQRQVIGGSTYVSSAVPKTFNGTTVTLDPGGRITLLNGMTFKYSHRGQLIGATTTNGLGAWFGHDAAGRRISRTVSQTVNNVTTFPAEEYYLWNGANVTATVDKNAAVKQSFLFEGTDQPLRLKDVSGKYYYEVDLAGNVRGLRRTDGTIANIYRYAGFGTEISGTTPAVDQPLRWKARWWDAYTGLYDVRARQWSPAIGSFTSIDEFVFQDERATLWAWPGQNPTGADDPTGHIRARYARPGDVFDWLARMLADRADKQMKSGDAKMKEGNVLGGMTDHFIGSSLGGLAAGAVALKHIAPYGELIVGLSMAMYEPASCPTGRQFTYRGDARGPDEIFASGFKAKGTNMNLTQHALGDEGNAPSGFVGTSTDPRVAGDFGDNVYVVRPTNGIDVNSAVPFNPNQNEFEVAVPNQIPASDVRALMGKNQSILNPNWKP